MKKLVNLKVLVIILLITCWCMFTGCGKKPEEQELAPYEPHYGGTLIYGRGFDSVGLDPSHETDGESFSVCDNIYDTLVQYKTESTELEPALATSWECSPDGLEWIFHLRQGVKFHDGTPFNADAVVFSLERQRDPNHPFHKVGGPYQYWINMGMSEIVKKVIAVNDSIVKIILKKPNAPFLANLAMSFASIVSPTALKRWKEDFFKHPCGTGPFKFVEWIKDGAITLERNPDYWGGAPYLDKVVFKSIPDNTTRLMELKTGHLDGMTGIDPDNIELIRQDNNLILYTQPGMNIAYLAMNCDKIPFNNIRIRQAINLAINKKAIVEMLYQNLATPAVNPIPPTMWSYNDRIVGYPYDPAQASKLLTDAGYPNGFETTLWTMAGPRPYMPHPLKIAQAIQSDLSRVGIIAKIVTYEWGTYLDKTNQGEHDMALLGWIGDNGDPDNFLYVLLDKNAARKPASNIAFYRNDELHELLLKAQENSNQKLRAELYRKAQEIIHRDAPWVPLVHMTQLAVFNHTVKNFKLHPTGKIRFHRVWKQPVS